MLDMEDLLAPMSDDPLLLALGAGADDLALLRPGANGMNFSLHASGSGATTSDGSVRLAKRRRGAQDGDEVRRLRFWELLCLLMLGSSTCWPRGGAGHSRMEMRCGNHGFLMLCSMVC
jgi:hypothetical protein